MHKVAKIFLSFLLPMVVVGCMRDSSSLQIQSGTRAMTLPVPPEYLALALENEKAIGNLTLRHRRVADLQLPTGKLVACDAFVFMDWQPFETPMPSGTFPVVLSIADYSDDQRVAFATVRFRDSAPVKWRMLTVKGQELAVLREDQVFGYGVDSGTGCFIDASAARLLERKMTSDSGLFDKLNGEMERTYVHTWSWLNAPFGEGNLVAFSTGLGDGLYATYAGFDSEGNIAVVVTDFVVVPLDSE